MNGPFITADQNPPAQPPDVDSLETLESVAPADSNPDAPEPPHPTPAIEPQASTEEGDTVTPRTPTGGAETEPAAPSAPTPSDPTPVVPVPPSVPVLPDRLSTQCPALDELLDGGIERDAIMLVFGEAGSGKTNLALQCARSVASAGTLPDGTPVPGKRVAYVDTEGVSPHRLAQIFDGHGDARDRLLFFAPFDIQQQERMVRNCTKSPDLGLIVVDSINMHYRLLMDGTDAEQKDANRSIVQQLHHLTTFARQHGVPVLITGQVYGGEDQTQPFARRTMEHLVKALVRFRKTPDGDRKATVLKHRSIEEGRQARFRISGEGLVDAD